MTNQSKNLFTVTAIALNHFKYYTALKKDTNICGSWKKTYNFTMKTPL